MVVGDIEILEIEPSKREDRGQPDRSAENFNGVNIYSAGISDKILEVRVFSQPWGPPSGILPAEPEGRWFVRVGVRRTWNAASLPQSGR
jgi:hypothetical protein